MIGGNDDGAHPARDQKAAAAARFKVSADVVAILDAYWRFVQNGRDFVVEHTLTFVFKQKDREFQDRLAGDQAGGATTPASTNTVPQPPDLPQSVRRDRTTGGAGESGTQ
ncbi:MAG: hypothetical protein ACRD2E_01670 [Terriglobales bacterium]